MEQNGYPTQRQEEAMRDVNKYPGDSLAPRADRLGVSRSGVLQVLQSVERKGLAKRSAAGKWALTAAGVRWLGSRP
jgi:Mn-dependent DtxR family transcriptional regulator